jgi:transcriptional regulator with XRE-family HTH domain
MAVIERERVKKGLTKKYVWLEAYSFPSTYDRALHGESNPTIGLLNRFANAVGIPLDVVVKETLENRNEPDRR